MKEFQISDFGYSSNNGVYALYVTNPEILKRDDHSLVGVPFLFKERQEIERYQDPKSEAVVPVTYFGMDKLDELVLGAQLGNETPKIVVVGGKEFSRDKLSNAYVPFSFGVYHEGDVERQTKVRDGNDYHRMVHQILPQVHEDRTKEDKKLGNRVKQLFGCRERKIITQEEIAAQGALRLLSGFPY